MRGYTDNLPALFETVPIFPFVTNSRTDSANFQVIWR